MCWYEYSVLKAVYKIPIYCLANEDLLLQN